MQYVADVIRVFTFARYVLPDPAAELASFTVGEVHDGLPFVQQTQVLSATTARKPLAAYGITATTQGGFHANRDHEIQWRWDEPTVMERYQQLDSVTRAAIDHFVRRQQ
jgi:hypothetical protein